MKTPATVSMPSRFRTQATEIWLLGRFFFGLLATISAFSPAAQAQPQSQQRISGVELPLNWGTNLEDPDAETDPYRRYWSEKRARVQQLESCSWMVRYRNRTYDLSPLTRKGLDRPLEGDMRTILRRVPAAAGHLEQIEKNVAAADVHTALATVGLTAFIVTRIFQGNAGERGRKSDKYIALSLSSGLLFLRSAYAGWQLKKDTKEELAAAIEAFNAKSPDPIVPHTDYSGVQ